MGYLNTVNAFHGLTEMALTEVTIKRMTEVEKHDMRAFTKIKQCYDNCFHLAHYLDCTYVLGVANCGGFPVAHAWLKRNGHYIDPTLDVIQDKVGDQYHMVIEVEAKDLIAFSEDLAKHGVDGYVYPPMLDNLSGHPAYQHFFKRAITADVMNAWMAEAGMSL